MKSSLLSPLLLLETVSRMRIARNGCTGNADFHSMLQEYRITSKRKSFPDAKEILPGFTHATISLEVDNTRTRTNKFTPLFFDGRNFVRLPNYLEQTDATTT